MRRVALDSSSHDLRALYGAHHEAERADTPLMPAMPWPAFAGWAIHGWSDEPREIWIRQSGTIPVGGYVLELPARGETELAHLLVVVDPAHRGESHGRRLLAHAIERARSSGRSTLTASTVADGRADRFATLAGAHAASVSLRQSLSLRNRLPPVEAVPGYDLVRWFGATPDLYCDGVAELFNAAGSSAGTWDAHRVRQHDQRTEQRGTSVYTVAARVRDTPTLAGMTTVYVDQHHSRSGSQGDTVVLPQYRGRRLALWLKRELIDWVSEALPELDELVTWNSEENTAICRMNAELGYQTLYRWKEWRLVLPSIGEVA